MRSARFGRALAPEQRQSLRELLARPRYELIPLRGFQESAAALPDGASVTVTASPRMGIDATIDAAEWLAARGYDVSPHVAARMIRDRAHAATLLDRMARAGIRKIFVVGGDGPPAGEYPDGLALLREIHSRAHAFEEIGVPSYPEGHASIPDQVLVRDLKEKQQYAHAMTTQMSFNPGAVAAWIARIRDEGIALPIHLGIPGVVELTRLMRIAARIGVTDSARYLMKQRGLLGHLVQRGSFGPDAFLKQLAPTLADPAARVRALHIFTMNQVAETVAWRKTMMADLD